MHLATAPGAPPLRRELSDILGRRTIRHVVVLGANGTMGLGSGALFTSAAEKVTFLARTEDKAQQGLDQGVGLMRSQTVASRVETGSYERDLERTVKEADLVFEAVAERMDVKQTYFEKIDELRKPDAIVATVTSGLSINELAKDRSESFRKHFLGLHLFNPPNVIVGTELVPGRDTDPEVTRFVEAWAIAELGRVIVRTADTPGFAGNRVGFKVLNEAAQLAEEHGPLLVDKLVGPYTGRALAPLATVDMVGWDIHHAIVDNVYENTLDEAHETLALPDYMRRLIGKGTLGNKSGGGFFMKDGKRTLVLDPAKGKYVPAEETGLPELTFIDDVTFLHRIGDYEAAMARFVAATGKHAEIAKRVVAGYVSYAFHRAGEVTDSIREIDLIMGFGFNWAPPSVLVDAMGLESTVEMIREAKLPVPEQLDRARAEGRERFFDYPLADPGKYFVAA